MERFVALGLDVMARQRKVYIDFKIKTNCIEVTLFYKSRGIFRWIHATID